MSSIFSKIIAGEIRSYKVYEDDHVFAFLNIYPHTPGHVLIVPKVEIDHFADVPEPYYSAIFHAAKKLSPILQEITTCTRVCTMFSGFEIPHAHYHLIPSMSVKDMDFVSAKSASPEELTEMQQKILSFLEM